MSLHQDEKYHLPSTLEPRGDDHSTLDNMITESEPLKNYLSTRQLPALNTLHQNDDYIRIKLSGMSVGVSPNTSPRVHPQCQQDQRGMDYFPSKIEENTTRKRIYDPIRSSMSNSNSNNSSNNTPLLRRVMHQDPMSQRRHSIANMDSRSTYNDTPSNLYQPVPHQESLPPLPPQQQQHLQQNRPSFPGHYSAPSSPPMHHTQQKYNINKHQQLPPPFSPYNRKGSMNADDDMAPPPLQQMRRNSSALVYRGNNRRMSTASVSRMNQIGNSNNEDSGDDMILNNKRDEMEGLYSRSPSLRVTHKLAERKRRKEMKDLFEELKCALPVDKSMKTSKWEILSKAVEYISILRHRDYNMEQELGMLKHQVENLKNGKTSVSVDSSKYNGQQQREDQRN